MNDVPTPDPVVPGLYRLGTGDAGVLYFLLQAGGSPPEPPPSFRDIWNDTGSVLTGYYLFLTAPIDDPSSFVNEARSALAPLGLGSQQDKAIVWVPSLTQAYDWSTALASALVLSALAPGIRAPLNNVFYNWAGFGLTVMAPAAVRLTPTGVGLMIQSSSTAPQVQFSYPDYQLQPTDVIWYPVEGSQNFWSIQIVCTGPQTGAFAFSFAIDPGRLAGAFGCGFNFVYPAASGSASLFYPLFPPVPVTGTPANYFGFAVTLHPLHPLDSAFTRFAFDFSTANPNLDNYQTLVSNYFGTTRGGSVTLAPDPVEGSPPSTAATPPGFAFCRWPASTSPVLPTDLAYYLAPVGRFRLVAAATAAGSPDSPEGAVDLQAGLFAQEFFRVTIGDLFTFETGRPAFAPAFGSQGGTCGASENGLDPTFTTAWVRYPVEEFGGGRGYFGQPSSSTYYGEVGDEPYPTAVAARLSDLAAPAVFPMVPYGGIYASQASSPQAPPAFNVGVPAVTFADFESQVMTAVRHAEAAVNHFGPVFLSSPDSSPGGGLNSATTPQGLLVELNPDGSWNRLMLAASPANPSLVLGFEGASESPGQHAAIVEKALASALLQDELFLVVADSRQLGTFRNHLELGGFNFVLDVGFGVGSPAAAPGTILIFKFNNTAPLKTLADRPDSWAAKAEFAGDVERSRQAILNAISLAERPTAGSDSPAGNPFAHFHIIANDPEWTGVIALNCAIDGNGMPPDLQMLLGGISGQLRAHHLGIQGNRVVPGSGSRLVLEQSSLFGVIYYQNPSSDSGNTTGSRDLDYEVETLTVVFSNSQVTQFHVAVGLTANVLFGRPVRLVSGSSPSAGNTLQIAGTYQVQNGVGGVTFSTTEAFVFTFDRPDQSSRVLRAIEFDSATLAPVSSVPASPPGETVVTSRFALGGSLFFQPDPFPGSDGLDLFSYGTATGSRSLGLPFTGLAVQITFALDPDGVMVAGSKTVTFDPSGVQFSPAEPGALRPDSLLAGLPLKLSKFAYSADATGLTPTAAGATPVHCLQLEGKARSSTSPALVASSPQLPTTPPGGYPYVTVAPRYALEFDLPLGSLGSLASIHVGLVAKFLLAWGPSRVVPDNDAASIMVQLPQVLAGYGGFELQGILKTTFGDANLLKVDVPSGNSVRTTYALLFNNVKLSLLGYSFPPGVIIDFVLFSGQPTQSASTNSTNLAWFLAAYQPTRASA